ncbi:hypothetical protein BKA69DRAFT_1039572 [Paraphysoderma sedebokerense]|nr:hypothetical protein BKA69DRAFT_1039572 [Paraphysoderma sedebokerense]
MPRLPPLSQNLNSEPLISPALIAEDNNALRTHTFDDPSIIQDPCPRSGNIYEEQDDQRILGDGDRKIGFEDNVNIKPKLTSISDNNEIRDDITSIKRNGFSQSSEKWKKREVVDQDKIQDDTSQHTKDTVATAIHQLDLQPDAEQGNPSDSLASSVLSREVPASIIPSHIIEKARRKSGKRTQAISIQNPRDDSRETTTKVQSDGSHQTINDLNHTDSGRSADVEPNALQTTSALRQQDDFEAAKKSYRRFKPPLTINTTRGSTVSAASSEKAPFKDAQDIGEIQLPEGRRGKRNKRTVASRQLALANNSEDSGSILQGPKYETLLCAGQFYATS